MDLIPQLWFGHGLEARGGHVWKKVPVRSDISWRPRRTKGHTKDQSCPPSSQVTGQITGRQVKAWTGEEGRKNWGPEEDEGKHCLRCYPMGLAVIDTEETKRLLPKGKRTVLK